MDLNQLIQSEIRRGASHQEIQELTAYMQSRSFNRQLFADFLPGNPHLPPPQPYSTAAYTAAPKATQSQNYTSTSIPTASNQIAGPAPKKRKRAKKDGPAGSNKKEKEEEKRGAVLRKAPSKAIQERAERVKTQRMFLISRGGRTEVPTASSKPNPSESAQAGHDLSESFDVLGSTGNCYKVVISRNPSCSCPDFAKGNLCKHLVFVYLKVLRIPEELHFWYQKALLSSEVVALFDNAIEDPTTRVADHVRKAWEKSNGSQSDDFDGITENEEGKKRIPTEGDCCPICFESFIPGSTKGLTFCLHACGNALHNECFKSYSAASRSSGEPLKCVFCRQPFSSQDVSKIGINEEGYLNLGSAAGLSTERDTSSYYHGPRAGERYYGNQNARYNSSGSIRGYGGYGRGWGGY